MFFSERAARDTSSAFDRSRLAALYLDRAREMGSFADFQRAEEMAQASLRLRESHNAGSYVLLASALMGQHRFSEAMRAAARADMLEPGLVSHRALIGEIAIELGDYDLARAVFDSLKRERLSDAASLRLARWYEISGQPKAADARLRATLAEWKRVPDISPANLGWLYARLGDLALKDGQLARADSDLTAGLAIAPNDHRLLSTAARLELRRGNPAKAIEFAERAIFIVMDPATLGTLSDALEADGNKEKAAEYAAVMRTVAFADTSAFPHRTWSLWMLDHDRDVKQVLRVAAAELRQRRDVYGWDLYAWALHKAGRQREAADAMRQALRMGTRDELLSRHAAAILGAVR